MYRLLSLDKDTYITNKIIAGSGSITSNVGQAGTLDLFKIWTQVTSGSTPTVENSRLLVHVDLDPLRALTGSILNIADSSFKTYLNLKSVYGGQTTPSNFTISIFPLAKDWDEGRGLDIRAFRDLDSANWVTASLVNGTPSPWAITGAMSSGSIGASGVDFYFTGSIGRLEVSQTFHRGDEDLYVDVTTLVSATLAGIIPDYGWRIALSGPFETDTNSYFVKRFGSRHTNNPLLHPKLVALYNESIQDDGNDAVMSNVVNRIQTYNTVQGSYANWFSGSNLVTGSNCAKLVLIASKSVLVSTSSWQQNFSASITYNTSSITYLSATFSASQVTIGGVPQTGFYYSDVGMNPQTTGSLSNFLSQSRGLTFQSFWTSNDGTLLYSSGSWINFTLPQSGEMVISERNFVVNVTNLKNTYLQDQTSRMRVFVQDRNPELPALRLPTPSKSLILKQMYWRLLNAFSRAVVVPFHSTGTKLSSDGVGMYFDLYMMDLDPNVVYEFEFKITENGRDYFIADEGFRFKVIP